MNRYILLLKIAEKQIKFVDNIFTHVVLLVGECLTGVMPAGYLYAAQ